MPCDFTVTWDPHHSRNVCKILKSRNNGTCILTRYLSPWWFSIISTIGLMVPPLWNCMWQLTRDLCYIDILIINSCIMQQAPILKKCTQGKYSHPFSFHRETLCLCVTECVMETTQMVCACICLSGYIEVIVILHLSKSSGKCHYPSSAPSHVLPSTLASGYELGTYSCNIYRAVTLHGNVGLCCKFLACRFQYVGFRLAAWVLFAMRTV